MMISELRKDTMGQLINGKMFTAEDGTQMILGETDVVAFRHPQDTAWQVAEDVLWNRVENLTHISEEQRFYWDEAYGHGYGLDNSSYGAQSTARIIDSEAGVIAYCHESMAPAIVDALNAQPLPKPSIEDIQAGTNPAE